MASTTYLRRTSEHDSDNLTGDYLTVAEVKNYLKISQAAAYGLAHSKDFPVCRLGGSIRIPKLEFLAWIKQKSSIPAHLQDYMRRMQEAY